MLKKIFKTFKVFLIVLVGLDVCFGVCYRKPQGATGDRSPVDENYHIQIEGNPSNYMPDQQYNISISCANGFKFISFTLLLEAELRSDSLAANELAGSEQILGHFEIIDNAETKFSNLCENMIESSNTNAKNRIIVAWVAPSHPQSGCVLFKAAILQHRNVWFIDDGFLTKRLCPEEIDEINSQTPTVNPCCTCDEAKYEIILERKWRRNTHAKDFPSEPWRTKLGDIIGASHSLDYRFWEYGGPASQGLQELGEHGATKTLENEIKQQTLTGSIRTIIKAPAIKYHPNVIGKSLATVRVGPSHHVISLVLKIDPSPDWILGVSGLELCLTNCTWIEKKQLNLYPWDIGTDAGPSYMSPDQAQHPPDVIRRISSTYPSDYRSPFFDKTGAPMKPLATLHVIRKRTYERECNFAEETDALECATHPWSSWTECSVKCGTGTQYRTRAYKDPQVAKNYNCQLVLRQNQECISTQCGVQPAAEIPVAECELSNWSLWSECSKKCGNGIQTRTRDYGNPYAKEKCQAGLAVELQQTRSCNGEKCGGNIFNSIYPENHNDLEYEQTEQDVFKNPKLNTNWGSTKLAEEQTNYDRQVPDSDTDFDYQTAKPFGSNDNSEEEYVDAKNIYGHDKLVGGKSRQQYYEPNHVGNKRLSNRNRNMDKETFKKRPLINSYYNSRDSYGFKGIDESVEETEAPQAKEKFCLEKPVATFRRCLTKRLIVKNFWFYDADDGECKLFTADNCDENKNKFSTWEKCLEVCSASDMPPEQDMYTRERYNSRDYEQPTYRKRWN